MNPSAAIDLLPMARDWFTRQGWSPFPFQEEAWAAYLQGYHGLVNAPTGSGKTYSLALPILLEFIREHPADYRERRNNGLRAIWVTPIRALTKEIRQAIERAAADLGLPWRIAVRSGDTSTSERAKQKKNPPEVLITTPESLHLLLATPGNAQLFGNLRTVVVDEWHELMGSKRGVQVELALSRLKGLLPDREWPSLGGQKSEEQVVPTSPRPWSGRLPTYTQPSQEPSDAPLRSGLKVWGISATIGNMDEALAVLLGNSLIEGRYRVIRADIPKRIEVISVLPDEIERFPWAGHYGMKLLEKVVPIIEAGRSTLIFTNTRAQCEIWYQGLLDAAPDLAGAIAMHHGSIDRHLRDWVENALHGGILKAVVCTSSLDLGVDFRPVETIVQIGSPKGVARFMQRAGRSGHQPGALSRIYFVPTHSLELMEGAALRQAVTEQGLERRIPYIRSFDVLLQYLVTLAVGDGFRPQEILPEVRGAYAFRSLTDDEWAWCLDFLTTGGRSLYAYDEYKKVVVEDGAYRVTDRRIALQHRLQIGAITSDVSLQIKYVSGKNLGTVEEWFIAQLKPGDVFWFAGRALEFVRIKEMTVQVRPSKQKTGKVPAWLGGRLSFSSQLSAYLRGKMDEVTRGAAHDTELEKLQPLLELQAQRSQVPAAGEFLMEYFPSREGFHLLMYPFEGRYVHEGMGSLMAYRLSQLRPLSFSIAMNDYGFELLCDQEIPIREALEQGLFSTENLGRDIQASINAAELARRRFRDIASIAGLVFKGYPGKQKRERHLQSSSQLFFDVFQDYEPDNLLLLQAYDEVMTFQLDEARLREALRRIQGQRLILSTPEKATPFSFPILVDRLRERLSSEKLADRIQRMKLQLLR